VSSKAKKVVRPHMGMCITFSGFGYGETKKRSQPPHNTRPDPIMLLKLPIMLLSNDPKFCLLCSSYAQLCPIMPQICS